MKLDLYLPALTKLEILKSKLAEKSNDEILEGSARLTPYRAMSSTTLSKSGHDSWLAANHLIGKKIKEGLGPSWLDIENLNLILTDGKCGKIRDGKVFIGLHKAINPEQLEIELEKFKFTTLENTQNYHPVIWASAVRYEFVTLHPFNDGNGRTSNLLCDWILGLNGFLPLSHQNKIDYLIGGWGDRAHFSTFDLAIQKTMKSLENSYKIMDCRK